MSSNVDPKDYFHRVMLAETFTRNQQKAKMMVDGLYKDIIAIKSTYKSNDSTIFGHLVVFINIDKKYILKIYNAAGTHASFFDNKPQNPLFDFTDMIIKDRSQNLHNEEITSSIENGITNLVNDVFFLKLKDAFQFNDPFIMSEFLESAFSRYGVLKENILIAFDQTSSLDLSELYSIEAPGSVKKTEAVVDDDMIAAAVDPDKKAALIIEKKHEGRVVSGRAAISPSGGISIDSLITGDEVYIHLKSNNDFGYKVVKALSKVIKGRIMPVKACVCASYKEDGFIHVYLTPTESNQDIDPVLFKLRELPTVKIYSDKVPQRADVTDHHSNLPPSKDRAGIIDRRLVFIAILTGSIVLFLIILLIILSNS